MKNGELNLKHIIYNHSIKTGKSAICVYYSHSGDVRRFDTGVKIDTDKWDAKECEPVTAKVLTKDDVTIVNGLYADIYKIISDYQKFNYRLPSIAHIENALGIKKIKDKNIHQLFQSYIKDLKDTKGIVDSSAEYYSYAAEAVKECDLATKYKLNTLNFNYQFYVKFVKYCREIKGNSNSTINQKIDVIFGFISYLDKLEIKHSFKKEDWKKQKVEEPILLCLERNELNAILKYIPDCEKNQRRKDLIVVLSHTGLRVRDIALINKHTIKNNIIILKPKKTTRYNITVKIPIADEVKDVLERWNYNLKDLAYSPKYLSTNLQEFCALILELGVDVYDENGNDLGKKHTLLTSHSLGRKTFINLCIQAGVPVPILMGMTGHTSLDTLLTAYVNKHLNNLPNLAKVFTFSEPAEATIAA